MGLQDLKNQEKELMPHNRGIIDTLDAKKSSWDEAGPNISSAGPNKNNTGPNVYYTYTNNINIIIICNSNWASYNTST